MTYTPPPRKNRRKGYEDNIHYTPEMLEEIRRINEMGFRTDVDLPQWELALQQTTDADEDIPSCRDKKENYEPQKRAVSDTDFPSIIPANSNCGEYSECFDQPVTQSVTVRDTDTEETLVMNVLTVATEQSELREMELCETDKRVIPVSGEELTIERRRPGKILPGAIQQVKMRNNLWDYVDYCFGVCGKADSVNRPETCSCWNYCCLIIWVYRVSCWPAILVNDRFYGIDLYTENRSVFTRELVLVGNPMTPYDVTRVYTKMNENFKGGINNVMIRDNDPVDRRYLQRCADNGLRSSTHTSVRGKPIREKGRFGYMDTPVCNADWSVEYSGGLSPVGDIRIGYLRDPVDRRQSTDAAPLTELLVFYTLHHLYDYCAAGSALSWTFCVTVKKDISVKELSLRGSVFPVNTHDGGCGVSGRPFRRHVRR